VSVYYNYLFLRIFFHAVQTGLYTVHHIYSHLQNKNENPFLLKREKTFLFSLMRYKCTLEASMQGLFLVCASTRGNIALSDSDNS